MVKGWVAAGWEAAGGAVAGWGVEGWEAMAELAEMGVEAATSPASSLQRRGRCNVIQALDHHGGTLSAASDMCMLAEARTIASSCRASKRRSSEIGNEQVAGGVEAGCGRKVLVANANGTLAACRTTLARVSQV